MQLQKINNDKERIFIFKKTSVQIETFGDLQFLGWNEDAYCTENEIISLLEKSAQLMLTLMQQYYLQKITEQKKYCSSMFFSKTFYEKIKDAIYILFFHKSAYKGYCSDFGKVVHVQVQGVSDYAITMLNKMQVEKKFSKDIERLYFENKIINDFSNEELYEYVGTAHSVQKESLSFLNSVSKEKFLHSINISGVSLDEFEKTGFIQSLLKNNKRVYLYTPECDFKKNTYFKYIIWE